MKLLEGKSAVITGASRGIGKAIATLFAQHGARLVLLARDEERLQKLGSTLVNEHGIEILCCPTDVAHAENVKTTFRTIKQEGFVPDIVVNNAGIMEDAVIQMVTPALIEKLYEVNVFGLIRVTQAATKLMLRNKQGSIINMSSILGTSGSSGQSIYGSGKSAVIGFTKSLSKELASLNIRVNAIAPGFIDTDMTKSVIEKSYDKNIATIGMGRIGQPEEVAGTALYLASDLSQYVTGQVIGVDGGMVI